MFLIGIKSLAYVYLHTHRKRKETHMKQITLHIPDHKVEFITELMEQLGIEIESGKPVDEDQEQDIEISEEHKAIVRERMKKAKANPERLLDWDEVKDSFSFD